MLLSCSISPVGPADHRPVSDEHILGVNSAPAINSGGYSDPIVQYDCASDRWLVGEIALPLFPGLIGQFAQCFAVSTTSDPAGSHYMWAYGFGTSVNDYPKIGIWSDGYYVTWNIFANGSAFVWSGDVRMGPRRHGERRRRSGVCVLSISRVHSPVSCPQIRMERPAPPPGSRTSS